jgi:hypothetical protein
MRERDQIEDKGVDGTKKLKTDLQERHDEAKSKLSKQICHCECRESIRALASKTVKAKSHTRYCGLVRGSHVEK